ncbi:MAG TPA: hypothetical protein VNP04_02530 [Alphaproteobacteria bacterium]|nr:hypothetical protein [Alphaproteobacteria bacterium]
MHPPPSPEAERRQLTVLCRDLVNSTALAGQLDLEERRAVGGRRPMRHPLNAHLERECGIRVGLV